MLKKLSHIILSVLLLVSTVGVVVSKHYCSGSFVSASVFHEAESCCGDSDCCHNEDSFYQVKDDFSAPAVLATPILAELDILSHDLFADLILESPATENSSFRFTDSPPPPTIQKVLSLKQVYLL
ncbi:hypothetical protein OU798_12090 [Prolixibacteraceae bacterium Z1-6]|uniref:Uncharacterized protein n=1 Tax=Draconibacterium aestuarii TaxID=2998507 RepID=A0A9X3FEA2_9BACT|nr:hypothetical protein [Prolixibacteraceae bacterium Z1-6]